MGLFSEIIIHFIKSTKCSTRFMIVEGFNRNRNDDEAGSSSSVWYIVERIGRYSLANQSEWIQ